MPRMHALIVAVVVLVGLIASPVLAEDKGLPQTELPLLTPGAQELAPRALSEFEAGKPRLYAYLLAEQGASELELRRLAGLTADLADALPVIVVMPPKPKLKAASEITAMLEEVGATSLPVFRDDGMAVGGALGLAAAPSLILVDGQGVILIEGARSLAHRVQGGGTVETLVCGLARGEPIAAGAKLAPFRPAERLIGSSLVDFALPGIDGKEVVVSAEGPAGKGTLLVFWSVRCPHCTQAMPGFVKAAAEFADRVDLITIARAPNAIVEVETKEYVGKQGLKLPVALDHDGSVSRGYLVVSTPTVVLAKAGGTIVGVKAGHVSDLAKWVAETL